MKLYGEKSTKYLLNHEKRNHIKKHTRKLNINGSFTTDPLKVEWYHIYGPKSLFKFGEKRPIVCCCTHEQKMNFEGFTQNGCCGNQSQPLEVLFDSTDVNNPCPFTKQDLIFKQAYLVGFCFVLFNKLKF